VQLGDLGGDAGLQPLGEHVAIDDLRRHSNPRGASAPAYARDAAVAICAAALGSAAETR
jgi:hypothetical protein